MCVLYYCTVKYKQMSVGKGLWHVGSGRANYECFVYCSFLVFGGVQVGRNLCWSQWWQKVNVSASRRRYLWDRHLLVANFSGCWVMVWLTVWCVTWKSARRSLSLKNDHYTVHLLVKYSSQHAKLSSSICTGFKYVIFPWDFRTTHFIYISHLLCMS